MKKITKIILILIVDVLLAHVCFAQHAINFDMSEYWSRSSEKDEPKEWVPEDGAPEEEGEVYKRRMYRYEVVLVTIIILSFAAIYVVPAVDLIKNTATYSPEPYNKQAQFTVGNVSF